MLLQSSLLFLGNCTSVALAPVRASPAGWRQAPSLLETFGAPEEIQAGVKKTAYVGG